MRIASGIKVFIIFILLMYTLFLPACAEQRASDIVLFDNSLFERISYLNSSQDDVDNITPEFGSSNTYEKIESVDKSFDNEKFRFWQQEGHGTMSFSPEYRLNNHVSAQSISSSSFLEKNKKSEFIFSIKPLNNDRVNLNVGACQVMYSESVRPPHSQVNFSTKFKL